MESERAPAWWVRNFVVRSITRLDNGSSTLEGDRRSRGARRAKDQVLGGTMGGGAASAQKIPVLGGGASDQVLGGGAASACTKRCFSESSSPVWMSIVLRIRITPQSCEEKNTELGSRGPSEEESWENTQEQLALEGIWTL